MSQFQLNIQLMESSWHNKLDLNHNIKTDIRIKL